MPQSVVPYPPAPPSITSNNLTVDLFLTDPRRVQRAVADLARQRFIADVIFGDGIDAPGGAVIYDQVTATDGSDLFLGRDVQPIEPGAEFPILTDEAPAPKVAATRKWGGRVKITDEARRRNRLDILRREFIRLRNTIIRKVDAVSIATLDAAPIQTLVGADWGNSANNPRAHLAQARLLTEGVEAGYDLDTLVLNPNQAADLLLRTDIKDSISEARRDALVIEATLGRLMGYDIVQSWRVPAGTAYALPRRQIGGIANETPLETRAYEKPENEVTFVQGKRVLVPYVTDPKAIVKITGI